MDLLHLILLGLVQGLTEFLPISSSAHLVLLPHLLGWEDQGLVYDIAAHLGSLFAVVIYFKKDLQGMFSAWTASINGGPATNESYLMWYLLVATLPVAVIGYTSYSFVALWFRSPVIIAIATIFFGLLLWWADVSSKRQRQVTDLKMKDSILIGLAQAIALIPGTSRSGITMTAGLMLGFDRTTAARFSFLLAIPTIVLAGGHEVYRFFIPGVKIDILAFCTVLFVSAISAWFAIKYFLKFLENTGMLPYVVYRFLLGSVLIYLFL